jgi:hypothetical protein
MKSISIALALLLMTACGQELMRFEYVEGRVVAFQTYKSSLMFMSESSQPKRVTIQLYDSNECREAMFYMPIALGMHLCAEIDNGIGKPVDCRR